MGEDLKDRVPTYDELFNPTLQALRDLGGSGANSEIVERVVDILDLPAEVVEFAHLGSETQTELEYRLAWARTYLKKYGLINNSKRGVWVLTPQGRETERVDSAEVKAYVKKQASEEESEKASMEAIDQGEPVEDAWRERLLDVLREMPPDAFERLCKLVLREAGFVSVKVTGKSGDEGIDGRGVIQLNGLLTFPIVFQCKRYSGAVGPEKVRDFRGAMVGRADRGLILTTGRFTQGARDEATRDGADPIDLVDGYAFAELLRDLGIGVETVERHQVDREFFEDV